MSLYKDERDKNLEPTIPPVAISPDGALPLDAPNAKVGAPLMLNSTQSPKPVKEPKDYEAGSFFQHQSQLMDSDPTFMSAFQDMTQTVAALKADVDKGDMPANIAQKRIKEMVEDHKANAHTKKQIVAQQKAAEEQAAATAYATRNVMPETQEGKDALKAELRLNPGQKLPAPELWDAIRAKNEQIPDISNLPSYAEASATARDKNNKETPVNKALIAPVNTKPNATMNDVKSKINKVDKGILANSDPSAEDITDDPTFDKNLAPRPYGTMGDTGGTDNWTRSRDDNIPNKPFDYIAAMAEIPKTEAGEESLKKTIGGEIETATDDAVAKPATDPKTTKKDSRINKDLAELRVQESAIESIGINSRAFQGEWEEDNHFPAAATQFFMDVMGGAPLGDAWKQANTFYDERVAIDKRHSYIDELESDGYQGESIEKWLQTGKEEDLVHSSDEQKGIDEGKGVQLDNLMKEQKLLHLPEDRLMKLQKHHSDMAAAHAKTQKDLHGDVDPLYSDMTEGQTMAFHSYNNMLAGDANMQEQYGGGSTGVHGQGDYPVASTMGEIVSQGMDVNAADGFSTKFINSLPAETKNALRAERDFVAGIMRRESGAAVSASEWATRGATYFPRKGDSPSQVARKSMLRKVATWQMQVQTGYSQYNGYAIANLNKMQASVDSYDKESGKYIFKDGTAATAAQLESYAKTGVFPE